MPYFQKIGIYANNGTSHVRSAITKLEASLDDFGCGVFFEKTSSINVGISKDKTLSIDDFCAEVDLCVVVGGDGSMLSACRKMAFSKVPLLGVNLGRLGFLTDISPNEIENLFFPVLKGDFKSSTRLNLVSIVCNHTTVMFPKNTHQF